MKVRLDRECVPGSPVRRDARARAVRRKIELIGDTGQCVAPVVDLASDQRIRVVLTAENLALPQCKVGELYGQRSKIVRNSLCPRHIRRNDVLGQRSHGEPVTADVMDDEHEDEFVGGELEECRPNRNLGGHVESRSHEVGHALDDRRLVHAYGSQVRYHGCNVDQALISDAVDLRVHSPKDLVPLDQILECALQRIDIERSAEPQRDRNMVDCRFWFESIEEPHALLCQRQRNQLGALARDQGNVSLAVF